MLKSHRWLVAAILDIEYRIVSSLQKSSQTALGYIFSTNTLVWYQRTLQALFKKITWKTLHTFWQTSVHSILCFNVISIGLWERYKNIQFKFGFSFPVCLSVFSMAGTGTEPKRHSILEFIQELSCSKLLSFRSSRANPEQCLSSTSLSKGAKRNDSQNDYYKKKIYG